MCVCFGGGTGGSLVKVGNSVFCSCRLCKPEDIFKGNATMLQVKNPANMTTSCPCQRGGEGLSLLSQPDWRSFVLFPEHTLSSPH